MVCNEPVYIGIGLDILCLLSRQNPIDANVELLFRRQAQPCEDALLAHVPDTNQEVPALSLGVREDVVAFIPPVAN